MLIALTSGLMTLTLSDGSTQVVNLSNVVDVTAEVQPNKIYGADNATQTTDVPQWFVRLHMNDNRWLDLLMGQQTGDGSGWANSQSGANTAVAAIAAVMP